MVREGWRQASISSLTRRMLTLVSILNLFDPGKLKGSSWFLQLLRCHRLTTSVERPYRLDQYDFSSMKNRLVYLIYLVTFSNQVIPVRWLNRCASLLRVAGLPTPVVVFFRRRKRSTMRHAGPITGTFRTSKWWIVVSVLIDNRVVISSWYD